MVLSNKHKQIKEALSHPMLLLIAGAIISSLIIPYFTRQWQDHQKELELKSDLSDQINKAVSGTLAADSLINSRYYNKNQSTAERYISSYIDFQTAKDVIKSKINIYFSDNQLAKNWDKLANAVDEFTNIAGNNPHDNYSICFTLGQILRIHALLPNSNPINVDKSVLDSYQCNNYYIPGLEYAQQVQTYFPVNDSGIDWNALLFAKSQDYVRSFISLKNDLTNYKDSLLATIFNSPMTAFK